MIKNIQAAYNSCLFYGGVLLFSYSPGELAWKLFKNKSGVVPLLSRDLICDTATLMALPKSENSLDEFTTAFSPFIPSLTLNNQPWKLRRQILASGLRKMKLADDFSWALPNKQGDIYWDVFEQLFHIGFQLVFGKEARIDEYNDMYPGIVDMNRMIKRQAGLADMDARWKLYHSVVLLLAEENEGFVFWDNEEFAKVSELDQVSMVVEDLLTSVCIQCTDLICHLILVYPHNKKAFKDNLDNCINETLRLYPLTDIWTRKKTVSDNAWIASLIQLNRNGWDNPDSFIPERWEVKDHPPLISWGFDARGCPATKIGYHIVKSIMQKIVENDNQWILPAANFTHERTFPMGCQVWIGDGPKPTPSTWNYGGKFWLETKQWFTRASRVFDQRELW